MWNSVRIWEITLRLFENNESHILPLALIYAVDLDSPNIFGFSDISIHCTLSELVVVVIAIISVLSHIKQIVYKSFIKCTEF